jgi:hypothetical protein
MMNRIRSQLNQLLHQNPDQPNPIPTASLPIGLNFAAVSVDSGIVTQVTGSGGRKLETKLIINSRRQDPAEEFVDHYIYMNTNYPTVCHLPITSSAATLFSPPLFTYEESLHCPVTREVESVRNKRSCNTKSCVSSSFHHKLC